MGAFPGYIHFWGHFLVILTYLLGAFPGHTHFGGGGHFLVILTFYWGHFLVILIFYWWDFLVILTFFWGHFLVILTFRVISLLYSLFNWGTFPGYAHFLGVAFLGHTHFGGNFLVIFTFWGPFLVILTFLLGGGGISLFYSLVFILSCFSLRFFVCFCFFFATG